MKPISTLLAAAALFACSLPSGGTPTSKSAGELTGLWEARRNFGPEVQGTLELTRTGSHWTGEIGPYRVPVEVDGCWLSLEIPGDRGSFRGCLETGGPIVGHWIQPPTQHSGLRAATPVELEIVDRQRWQGVVAPLEDRFTHYLVVEEREDGTVGAFLRNPERNVGIFVNADRLEREGDDVRLVGHWFRSKEESVVASGHYVPDMDVITLRLRGASFDFRRVDHDTASGFYARGRNPEPWTYRAPPALDDGWPVGTLEEAGISPAPIRELISREIAPPARDVHAPYVHAMLVARRGKLVLEEYFHGFHRDRPHDSRSASKSAAAVLVGAAIHAGEPVSVDSPVYETILGKEAVSRLDARTRSLRLEHLLTMSSGLDCDDRDPNSPGNEDHVQSQRENPDWYQLTLALDRIREPGERAVYCSVNTNLIGNVLTAGTGERLETLFHRLVARPLDVGRYHMYLQPTGEPYLGGGTFWRARDFMKLGQLMLNGGTWSGRRILSEEFTQSAVTPLYELRERGYGYQWWVKDYPYRGETVRAFFAGGNGGQVIVGLPELDLLVTFFAGNYSDPVLYRIQEEFLPEFLLRALE